MTWLLSQTVSLISSVKITGLLWNRRLAHRHSTVWLIATVLHWWSGTFAIPITAILPTSQGIVQTCIPRWQQEQAGVRGETQGQVVSTLFKRGAPREDAQTARGLDLPTPLAFRVPAGKASLETLLRLRGNPGTNALLALWGGLSSNPTQQGISQPSWTAKASRKTGQTGIHISMPGHRGQNL